MDERRETIALFWYDLLNPLLRQGLDRAEKRAVMDKITSGTYVIPYSSKRRVTAATVRRKLRAFREGGFRALAPAVRSDKGQARAVPEAVLERALELKAELPQRSVRTLIELLGNDPTLPAVTIAPSTLSRLLHERGYTRQALTDRGQRQLFRKFERKHINSLWQGDAMHGPYLPHPDRPGHKKQTFLFAFLDDCSRVVPHGAFYWDERLPRLEDCLRQALQCRGLPHDLYVDNGHVYCSKQLKLICADLGIRLIHTPPYRPQGRGKIERFFGSVQSEFLPEAQAQIQAGNLQALDDLNHYFQAWLHMSYHRRVHGDLGRTPLEVWEAQADTVRYCSPEHLEGVFLWRDTRVVNRHGVVSVQGNDYEVGAELVGQRLDVRFNPFDLKRVVIYRDGEFLQHARLIRLKTEQHRQVRRGPRPKPPEPKAPSASYLDLLVDRYDHLLQTQQATLTLQPLHQQHEQQQDQVWQRLLAQTEARFGRSLVGYETRALRGMLERYGAGLVELVPHVAIAGDLKQPFAFSHFLEALRQAHVCPPEPSSS
jgi:transposase InsO family protein